MWVDGSILVVSFVALLALGMPIAFAIGGAATLALLISMPPEPALTTVAQRMATGLDAFSLLAIPFFILAGQIMNRGGLARRLVDFARAAVGGLPGGLAYVNVVAAMLFGAVSGSAVASASAIGGVMTGPMREEGYDRETAAAINVTAATTGLVIPPSNILIVYSLAAGGVSIAALFIAGYLPGLLVGLALMAVAAVVAPARRPGAARASLGDVGRRFVSAAPSLLLLVVVIGGIVGGLFTATEASAVAVLYALVLAAIYREVSWRDVPSILRESVEVTSVVLLLIAASMAMSWVLAYAGIPQALSASLLALTESKIAILLIINLVLLAVGTVMDMTPAVLIFTPIFLPVVEALGMDPVHFGIVLVMNLCIGLCTPPVGSVLFVGCGVAETSITAVTRPLLPFFAAMVVALLAVTYLPWLSLWLPSLFGF
ncbi:MAG: TRAP transporter large permease subunit [Acidobacteriota bacterium]